MRKLFAWSPLEGGVLVSGGGAPLWRPSGVVSNVLKCMDIWLGLANGFCGAIMPTDMHLKGLVCMSPSDCTRN